MRHVPTSLYIDTEYFKRQNLRFDTQAFTEFKGRFVKQGLRLLVPKIMERELLRHFHRKAEEIAYKLEKTHEEYYVEKLALVNLPSQNDLKTQCVDAMERQWSEFKEHFVVENLPIVGNLDDVVDWYFEIRPPFSEGKPKEFPDALIISALDQYHKQHHANIAVISADGDFSKACAMKNYFLHFADLNKYTEAFQPEQSGEERLPGDIDPTKPIATEDLTELKAILARGSKATTIEIDRVMNLLESRGSNYDYFFQSADDAVWLHPLSKRGYFDSPPDAKKTTEGYIDAPWWPPLEYLIRVFDAEPSAVLAILSKLSNSDNFRVLEGIFKIVLKSDSVETILEFSRFITSYVENCQWGQDLIISLLKKPFIFDSQLSEFTPALILKVVEFHKDPRELEKEFWSKDSPEAVYTLLVPAPRFDQWEYEQILEKGVRPLAKHEPYQVARILVDAVASMIRLGMHQQDFNKGNDEDSSEIWCPKLNTRDTGYQDIRGSLVQTLTYACEQVYRKAQASIDPLDQVLRNHRWKVFRRLRQHLYADNLNDQTLPWIREQILGHEDYSRWHHQYELKLMIRKATEHFGPRLLSEDEQKDIFDNILSGPSREDFREWMGEKYSNEKFQNRQHYFHYVQLRPFAALLSGEVRDYFTKLEVEFRAEDVTDDTYLPFKVGTGGVVQDRSPRSIEDLQILADEELVSYLNEWDQEHRDNDNWLIEINISALAGVFQTLFKEQVVHNRERLTFWMTNRDRIERPVYIVAMLKSMLELVKEKKFENLDLWIEFCSWVLSHPDPTRKEGQPEPRGESRDYPDWSTSHRAVVDFIDACLSKDNDAPITVRHGLAKLLLQVCTQADWRLDHDQPVLLNQDDPITQAINNTRSRALESLVSFGFWIKRNLPDDNFLEVTDILSQRMTDDTECPLTRPEHALLGMQFGNLCQLNPDWVAKHRENFFPQGNELVWWDAFGSYLRFNGPAIPAFEILRDEFRYALENLESLLANNGNSNTLVNRLGQHLFAYYLWKVYPLVGNESLLECFYTKTNNNRVRWADLFDYIGRSLKISDRHLDQELINRVIELFNWRHEVSESMELKRFSSWLEAECLDPDWRLQSYLMILDISQGRANEIYLQVKQLTKFLPDHLSLVAECFAKVTESINQENQVHIPTDEAKTILKAGLNSEDQEIKKNAERARDNLLRSGRFEFLDIDQ